MSMKSLSLVAAAALALCAGAAQAATTNGFSNGGFEDGPGATTAAKNWLAGGNTAYTLSSDAHTGKYSASLAVPNGFGASVIFQNSVEQGGLPPLTAGDTPSFSFWTKGDQSVTGDTLYALRFLDGTGNILANTGNVKFVPTATWTQITLASPLTVPNGAVAAFLEISAGVGPILENRPHGVLIDDVYLGVAAIPEPSTYALMLAGLAGVGVLAKRRRQA